MIKKNPNVIETLSKFFKRHIKAKEIYLIKFVQR